MVIAIYEITPVGIKTKQMDDLRYAKPDKAAGFAIAEKPGVDAKELGFLKMRYKLPAEEKSKLLELPIADALVRDSVGAAPATALIAR